MNMPRKPEKHYPEKVAAMIGAVQAGQEVKEVSQAYGITAAMLSYLIRRERLKETAPRTHAVSRYSIAALDQRNARPTIYRCEYCGKFILKNESRVIGSGRMADLHEANGEVWRDGYVHQRKCK